MNVLFLGQAGNLQPWFDDVVSAVGEGHRVTLFDTQAPLKDQFRDVVVVVDQGGSVGTHAMVDAAAEAGVKLWQVLGTGLDHVDIDYVVGSGLPLANTPGPFSSVALAEHALLFMLYFAKHVPLSQEHLRQGSFYHPMNDELDGATLGLVGLGASGRELAKRAAAFDMRILGLDVVPPPDEMLAQYNITYLGGPEALHALVGQSDYVSIHVPLTSQTRHLLDARALAMLRPNAILINVARGEIVDQEALVIALREHSFRGAGIDVFPHEPLPRNDPLMQLDNVLLTPHVAGVTTGTSRRRAGAVAENVRRVVAGLTPLYTVTRAE